MIDGKYVVQGADIHDCIAIEVSMSRAIGAAVVDAKWCLDVVELLNAGADLLNGRAMGVHPDEDVRSE